MEHPNIVKIYDLCYVKDDDPGSPQFRGKINIVMELVSGGDLFAMVNAQRGFAEDAARFYFRQLMLGLSALHARGICHRDLKLENVLVTSDNPPTLKICDFGFGKQIQADDPTRTILGTAKYVAPELLLGKKYDVRHVFPSLIQASYMQNATFLYIHSTTSGWK